MKLKSGKTLDITLNEEKFYFPGEHLRGENTFMYSLIRDRNISICYTPHTNYLLIVFKLHRQCRGASQESDQDKLYHAQVYWRSAFDYQGQGVYCLVSGNQAATIIW